MDSVSNSDDKAPGSARSLLVRAVLMGGIVGTLLSLLAGDFERRTVFDTWQRLSPREISMDNVAVVLIDDVSVKTEGAWPWSRYKVARLIENISRAQPSAIGIDIYFTEPDPLGPGIFASNYEASELDPATKRNILALPNFDDEFAKVLGVGPIVLSRFATETDGKDPVEEAVWFNSFVEGQAPAGELGHDLIVTSIAALDDVTSSHGMVNGPPDSDGIVRRVPLSVRVGDVHAPGFALELARVANGVDSLVWSGSDLVAGNLIIPTRNGGRMDFKMGHFPNPAIYPASAVTRGQIPTQAFADKVVLVGVGATGTFDIVATPLRPEIYGVLVQAQAVDAILEQQWLSRPPSMIALEILAAALLLGLIFSAGFQLRNWLLWPAFGLALVMPFASWLAFTQVNLLFDPVRPILIATCAAIALWITRYALARAELVEQRIRASEQKGELDAARRIQMSMVPSPTTLSRLDYRTEIGAVLEPAKSVGGDFFDAVKIGDDLLLFMVGDVTGKGVPAALFMALSKTLSKSNLARAGAGLAEAVAALNRDLMDEADEEMGLTMLVGTIDCATGAIQMINAGHENPMIVRKDTTIETMEMVGGPPFCVIEFPYPVETSQLDEGDTLVVITDGATEAANEAVEMFGISGVLEALNAPSDGTAASRAKYLAKEVRLFEGSNDPTDDLTIFALRYLGNAS